ncbi:hypothetical protein M8009_18310 [Halomonas sp. ATCH28]|uniref:Uncharacterized protein n=1 Tax=Halomonas gemina TaxID=2945105 RepID=A0ABT0T5R1_9GAMM|nr:hypothetical protein [Halomonas gemina]MCL7942236.1 hypothetical protein [Halomonas gemina]
MAEEQKSLMERMREFQQYEEQQTEEAPAQEEAEPHTSSEEIKEKLKAYLYDDSLVEEFASAFMSIPDKDSLGKVLEVLAAKEGEIKALTENKQAFQPQSNPDAKQAPKTEEPEIDPVAAILAQRYK